MPSRTAKKTAAYRASRAFWRRAVLLAVIALLMTGCAGVSVESTASSASTATPTPLPDISIAGLTVAGYTTALDLAGRDMTLDALISALGNLPLLESLDLTGCPLSNADKAALMAAYPAVRFSWTVEITPDIAASSGVTSLDLDAVPLLDAETLIQALRLLPSLETVDLCDTGLSDADIENIRTNCPDIHFVWTVRIACFELRTDITAFSMGQRKDTPGVRVVGSIYYDRITNEDILPLQYCTELIALDLGHARHVSDVSCLRSLDKLRYLVLAIMDIEDISVVKNMPELVFFECCNNRISDISPVAGLKNLKYLNCGMNPFTDIAPLCQMTQLERLWINRGAFSREERALLTAALPDTEVMCAFGADPMAYGWRSKNQGYLDMQEIFGLRALGQ